MSPTTQDIHPVCKMRSGIVCLCLLFGFVLIGCRLFYLQVLQSDAGAHQVKQQHQKMVMVQPDRGVIFDRHGHPLAMNVDVPSVYVNTDSLENPQKAARDLAPVLKMSVSQLREIFQRAQSRARVKRHIPEDMAKQLEAMEIPGVVVTRAPHRFYPKGALGSHILGFAGDDNQGLEGIEFHYESYLRGEENLVQYQRDALGGVILSLDRQDSMSLQAGYHVTLSIDEVIQFIAEDELAKAVQQSRAKSGTILIMDPMTGSILAWALYPTFDPNHFRKLSAKDWRNRAVTDPYEPGSTLKVVVAAAALEELRDALGGVILSLDRQDSMSLQAGYHVTLSIDEVIQFIAEDELAKAVQQSRAKSGTILIMDPMTGSILAWALYPTFDPNHFRKLSAKDWRNRAVTDPYEPGSTLKVVVAAAALEEGVMEPETLIYGGDGQMPVAGTIVHDHAKSSWMTLTEVVAQSSNVGVIKVAVELRRSRMFKYLKAFGFGEKTGIDLSGESSGILHHPDTWSGRSLSSLAIGQEIAVTPIQMVTAMSVVANGGWLMTPHVVSLVVDARGKSILTNDRQPKRRPISFQTARRMGHILEAAVETGTGKGAKLVGYRVAGKTGTSQKIDSETGTYSSSNVIASFVGFVPAEQPCLTMLVVIDDPKEEKLRWGGKIAAPVFGKVAKRVLPHMGILPGGAQLIRTASFAPNSSSLQALVQ